METLGSVRGDSGGDGVLDDFHPDKQPSINLIIIGKSGHAVGRIDAPTWWSGLTEVKSRASDEPHQYDSIVLCESRDARAQDFFSRVDEHRRWRYRMMLVESKWEEQYYERVAV